VYEILLSDVPVFIHLADIARLRTGTAEA